MDIAEIYALEMIRKRRLRDTVREDISWDILIDAGGATHTIQVQCIPGQTANIDWGDNSATEATATTLTSYAHAYAAGTHTIVITGGAERIRANSAYGDSTITRTRAIRNLNSPGLLSLQDAFSGAGANVFLAEGCRLASSIVDFLRCFSGCSGINAIPNTFKLPPGIHRPNQMLAYCTGLTYFPLSFWPEAGFTYSGMIDIRFMFAGATNIQNSIAPSNLLWDSGKTFNISSAPPFNSTGWLNYAAAYTDPATGITYSKIPYAWGGAAD